MSNNKYKILVVEDDRSIVSFIQTVLETNGYQVLTAQRCQQGILMMTSHVPDLVLLDLGLPDMDGEEFIRATRCSSAIPIIVLSARSEEDDKVSALDLGANDYITKPFDIKELQARVSVQLRRFAPDSIKQEDKIILGELTLDSSAMTVSINDSTLELTKHEYKIMELLIKNPDRVFSKQAIYDYAWEDYYIGEDKTINVHISNIRKKIRAFSDTEYIETVWSIGFKINK
jgi:DNA-binding response OmpR family regulator